MLGSPSLHNLKNRQVINSLKNFCKVYYEKFYCTILWGFLFVLIWWLVAVSVWCVVCFFFFSDKFWTRIVKFMHNYFLAELGNKGLCPWAATPDLETEAYWKHRNRAEKQTSCNERYFQITVCLFLGKGNEPLRSKKGMIKKKKKVEIVVNWWQILNIYQKVLVCQVQDSFQKKHRSV